MAAGKARPPGHEKLHAAHPAPPTADLRHLSASQVLAGQAALPGEGADGDALGGGAVPDDGEVLGLEGVSYSAAYLCVLVGYLAGDGVESAVGEEEVGGGVCQPFGV